MKKLQIDAASDHNLKIPVQIMANGSYLYKEYMKQRKKLIAYCLDKGMTYEQIGELVGITKARVYQIIRYGGKRPSMYTRHEVKKRDDNRCRICKKRTDGLHLHHLDSPKDQSKKNLITLCPKCHIQFEKYKKSVYTPV
jgi:5-methylcytosine-specific restriction endonuclease McrA